MQKPYTVAQLTGEGASRAPAELNVETGPPVVDMLKFSTVFFNLFFLHFSECFCFLSSMTSTTSRDSRSFLNLFLSCLAGPIQLSFAPLAQTSSYATAYTTLSNISGHFQNVPHGQQSFNLPLGEIHSTLTNNFKCLYLHNFETDFI